MSMGESARCVQQSRSQWEDNGGAIMAAPLRSRVGVVVGIIVVGIVVAGIVLLSLSVLL